MISWNVRRPMMLTLVVVWGGLLPVCGQTAFETDCAVLATNRLIDGVRLSRLLELDWDYTMRENPEFATEVGYPGYNDRWTDNSLEAIERR